MADIFIISFVLYLLYIVLKGRPKPNSFPPATQTIAKTQPVAKKTDESQMEFNFEAEKPTEIKKINKEEPKTEFELFRDRRRVMLDERKRIENTRVEQRRNHFHIRVGALHRVNCEQKFVNNSENT